MKTKQPAFLFDLDGTLLDNVYQHILAWREALETIGFNFPNWVIHRHVGMSDSLMLHAFQRQAGRRLTSKETKALHEVHTEAFMKRVSEVRALPGASSLLAALSKAGIDWAIATSGLWERMQGSLRLLNIQDNAVIVTGDDVKNAKPDPDLFLAAARKLKVGITDCVVVGDSVWDLLAARRARALGVGFLCGGYGENELVTAGAYRVYKDPQDLLAHIDEVGIRLDESNEK